MEKTTYLKGILESLPRCTKSRCEKGKESRIEKIMIVNRQTPRKKVNPAGWGSPAYVDHKASGPRKDKRACVEKQTKDGKAYH